MTDLSAFVLRLSCFVIFRNGEIDLRPFAAADPVSLQQFDSFWPIQTIKFIQKPFGEGSDATHPLPHRPSHHRKPADLAFAVAHFLLRHHRPDLRTPSDE